MTTYCIDWLSFTIPQDISLLRGHPAHGKLATWSLAEGVTEWKSEKPRFGYSVAFSPSSFPGPVVYCWPLDGRSHTHVQWSGSALASRGSGEALLREVVQRGDRVTRLDLAVDVDPGHVHSVYEAFEAGEVLTAARQVALMRSKTGDTVYIGSRTSGRFVRVYDKSGQLGQPGSVVRVELEAKGDTADGLARYIVQEGSHVIPEVVRGVIDCPTLPWWVAGFGDTQARWGVPKISREPNRAAWIDKQVTPALIDMHRTDPQQFLDTYRALCRRVGEATGCWPVEFDGHTVDRYNEVMADPDEVSDINPIGRQEE